jgi:hypothetical protein
MKEQIKSTAKRVAFSLLLVSALGGCATYASGPYAQPAYYGAAPVSVGVGFYQSDYGYNRGGYRYQGRNHGYRGARHHGFKGHGGGRGHPGRGGGHRGGGHR